MEISFAYFIREPLKTEQEIEDFMADLGIEYYEQYVEITIDPKNIDLSKLNKEHYLYCEIEKAKEKGFNHFSFYL
jgi:hypothetical protein